MIVFVRSSLYDTLKFEHHGESLKSTARSVVSKHGVTRDPSRLSAQA
jgi:hypothetical protein